MRIGIDLDDVIADLVPELIKFLNDLYKADLEFKEIKSWEIWKYGNLTEKEFKEGTKKFIEEGGYSRLPVIKGAVEGVNRLKELGEVYIVTRRSIKRRAETISWLRDKKIKYDGIYFSNNGPKTHIFEDINPNLIIDDSPSSAKDLLWFRGFFLYDKPWNKHVKIEKNRRLKSWKDILKKVEEREDLIAKIQLKSIK